MDKRYYEQIDGKTVDITEEIPFDLPDGWTWCRIGMVSSINPRNHIDDCIIVSFMPMTQLEGGYGNGYTLSEKKWGDVKTGFTHFQENDVVFAKITPCFQNRKSAVMRGLKNGYGAGTTELHVIRCFSCVLPEYVLWFVKNQTFISNAVSTIQGVVGQQRIDANFVKGYFLPLPPLAEQKRIVAQIENLLNCMDKIDQESATLEKSLTLAKQKILDLAIRGKLVPQDPNDEPASELLKKIKAEKETLIKSGKLKRDKHESFIFRGDDNCYYEQIDGKTLDISEQILFDIPESWKWTRLNNIATTISSKSHQIPEKDIKKIASTPVISQGQNYIDGYSDRKDLTIYDLPIILFGDHTKNVKYIDFPFIVGADGCKLVKTFMVSPQWLYYWLSYSATTIRDRGYARHWGLISSAAIPLPPLKEQQRIAEKIAEINLALEATLE